MNDALGYPINVGDILVQCANEYGIDVYKVRRDPAETTRLHVTALWHDKKWDKAIAKKSRNMLNLSAIFGDVVAQEEIERRLTELHDA